MPALEKDVPSSDIQSSLEVIRHLPSHILFDTWVEFEIKLNDATPRSPRSNSSSDSSEENSILVKNQKQLHSVDVSLSISRSSARSLVEMQTEEEESLPILTTDPSFPIQLSLSKKKCQKIIQIKIVSRGDPTDFFDHDYCLCLHPKSTEEGNNEALVSLRTKPFKLAINRLHIQTEVWDDIWYKDEGGREKCMHVTVSLRDKDNEIMKHRKIPIKPTLLYENDQQLKVMRQEILHIFGPTKREISPKTGTTNLRFRIDDVSKNHQGQNFMVQVEEETPKYSGIAPAITPSVSIRSKRNKRQRTTSSGKSDGSSAPRFLEATHPMSRSPFSMEGSMGVQEIERVSPIGFQGISDDREVQRLRDAMKGVIKWTEEVVNGLYPLQWQVVGYSPHPDGSFDYHRPYHSMPNPNACISKILSMYSESTREHLRVLISAVEHTRPDPEVRRQSHTSMTLTGTLTGTGGRRRDESRRRSPQTILPLREEPKGPYFETPPYPSRNPYPKPQDSFTTSAFDPPWDRYRQTRNNSPMERPRNVSLPSYRNNSNNPPSQNHVPLDFSNSPLQVPRRTTTDIHPLPLQMNPRISHNPHSNSHSNPDSRMGAGSLEDMDHLDVDDRQAEVAFVLATEYVSPRSRDKLGFPAYTKSQELIGFFCESKLKPGSATFTSTARLGPEFGPREMAQATQDLTDSMARKSGAVHAIDDWGTVRNLVDHAMVYDWNNAEEQERKRALDNSPINYV